MFKKTLLAAALAVAAGSASAAIVAPNQGSLSELFLFVGSTTSDEMFVADLGIAVQDFRAGSAAANGSLSFSLTGNADYADAWNSFASSVAAENRVWGVVGADGTPQANRDTPYYGLLFTSMNTPTTVPTHLGMQNATANATQLFVQGWNFVGNHSAVENGAAYRAGNDSDTSWVNYTGKLASGANAKVRVEGAWGAQMGFYEYQGKTMGGLSNVDPAAQFGSEFGNAYWILGDDGFGGASLSYVAAVVPEPETYGMLLAGLGVVGMIARRRRQAI